jgi:hypothetical protein
MDSLTVGPIHGILGKTIHGILGKVDDSDHYENPALTLSQTSLYFRGLLEPRILETLTITGEKIVPDGYPIKRLAVPAMHSSGKVSPCVCRHCDQGRAMG